MAERPRCYPSVVVFSPEMLAMLEAQRAYLASDAHLLERAERWRNATPEECLVAVIEQCEEARYFLELKTPEELERVLAPTPLPADTILILEALARAKR
jgi:hypothetical protein